MGQVIAVPTGEGVLTRRHVELADAPVASRTSDVPLRATEAAGVGIKRTSGPIPAARFMGPGSLDPRQTSTSSLQYPGPESSQSQQLLPARLPQKEFCPFLRLQ